MQYITLLRVNHWIKNLFIFQPLLFSERLGDYSAFFPVSIGFISFCLVSSSVYIMNDILDKERDMYHPIKRLRPIASNNISIKLAILLSITLVSLSFYVSYKLINFDFIITLSLYWLGNILYSLILKNIVVVDVLMISFFFGIRLLSGALILNCNVSEWFILSAMFISILLGCGKRRHELLTLGEDGASHREVLKDYNLSSLDKMIFVAGTATLLSYALYTVSDFATEQFGSTNLIYTTVFVIYGISRYIYIVYRQEKGGDPTQLVFSDKHLLINIILWMFAIYTVRHIGGTG